ncbi:MAG: hypothetical protein IJY09_10530 [Lachnospiraceae bacterium]|nr:hypothetical protein [Lachnospiraceae bacterium]
MNKRVRELNRLNNELDAKVEEKNQEIFTNMVCYLRGASISPYDQEMVRHDLLEMILSAQERGEELQTVIGENYQAFCDNIIASLPPQTTKQKVIDLLDTVCACLAILGLINIIMSHETITLIKNLVNGQPVSLEIAITLGDILAAGLIIVFAVLLVKSVMKNAFREEASVKRGMIKAGIAGAGAMAAFLLLKYIGKKIIFTVNILVALAIVLGLFVMHKILERLS